MWCVQTHWNLFLEQSVLMWVCAVFLNGPSMKLKEFNTVAGCVTQVTLLLPFPLCVCVRVHACLCLRRIDILRLGPRKSQAMRECVCTCGLVCCRSIPLLIDCRLVLADADERNTAFQSRSSTRQRSHKHTQLKHAFVLHSIYKRS